MDDVNEYKCKLFFCVKRNGHYCCEKCEKKEQCESPCCNRPQKCGYSTRNVREATVQCPFFISRRARSAEEKRRIRCEGMIKGTNDLTEFETESELIQHMLRYCCEFWQQCPKAKDKEYAP